MLREMEFRECEADMDITELRADILQLRERYEPKLLEAERCAQAVKDLADNDESRTRNQRLNSTRLEQDSRFDNQNCFRNLLSKVTRGPGSKENILFTSGAYPCYVVSLSTLQMFERLPVHEDALFSEQLDLLDPNSIMPASAFTYFVSQNWETFGENPHPGTFCLSIRPARVGCSTSRYYKLSVFWLTDNHLNTKIKWLQCLRSHLKIPDSVNDLWIWW